MKKTLFFFLFLIPGLLAAQTGDHCAKMLQKAKAALKIKKYTLARDYCEAALPLCPDMAAQFEQVQSDVNKGIENEKITAKREAEKARRALEQVKTVNNDVAELLLRNTEEHFLKLEYDAAFEKMNKAALLEGLNDRNKTEVAFFLMEIAYFHHHTHQNARARAPYDLAAGLLGKNALKGKMDFDNLHAGHARFLKERYFPNIQPLPGGTFLMGRDSTREQGYDNELPRHEVQLSPFGLAATETTFWQWNLYITDKKRDLSRYAPSWGIAGDNPAVNLDWFDACEYANWLSEREGKKPFYEIDSSAGPEKRGSWKVELQPDGNGYRLPTEAEWEYAARGGPGTPYYIHAGSDDLDLVGWHDDNSKISGVRRTHPVGQKQPVVFPGGKKIFDLSGNVWEWCWDWYDPRYYEDFRSSVAENPVGVKKGVGRVFRGGSWSISAEYCRAANRNGNWPYFRGDNCGFRLALSPQ
jgi:formylglycine-generating enzyme